ncbi:uncharacterized protein A4U43_C08F19890 [Asparagus officinalis]|nr:uncharacterized protein A4U43_C08F19890 [Asparagus officinalis]
MGTPSSTAFWRSPGLDRFAISHRLQRGDSVAGLALKYSVQDSSPSAKITDEWGEKSDLDPEAASEPDPPRDEDD